MADGLICERDAALAPLRATFDRRLPSWMTGRNIFLLLFLSSLTVNLCYGLLGKFRPSPATLEADELEYYNMASQFLAGTLQISARRTLLFPLAIAGIRSISDNFLFLQATITAFFSLSAPLLFAVVRRVTGSLAAGALAGLALVFWPPVVHFGVSLYSESMALPVFLLTLLALPPGPRTGAARPRREWPAVVLAGFFLALAAQVRPMYLIMTPFLALIILGEERHWRRAAGKIMLAAAAFALTTLPWSAYMTARFHHPILITSNGGETLAGGLNPGLLKPEMQRSVALYDREAWVGPGKWVPVAHTGYLRLDELAMPYDQQDKILKARAWQWVKAHPADAVYLELCKIGYMWGVYPLDKNSLAQALFGNIPTILLVLFCASCLFYKARVRRPLIRFWILPLFVAAVALISWGSWRFRQPGDVGLIAYAAVCLLVTIAERRAKALGAGKAGSLASAAV